MSAYHSPVLLQESIEGLNIKPDGVYVDVTFGGGGHSREILSKLTNGKLIAFDQDDEALANAPDDENLILVKANFRFLGNFLDYLGFQKVDGILADLGVSSHHFDDPERGFSFRFDGNLDMRMNMDAKKTAQTVLNDFDAEQLNFIFKNYGEINLSRKLVAAIIRQRQQKQIIKIADLIEIVSPLIPKKIEHKFLAKIFQAIRIEVNDELQVLQDFLIQIPERLNSDGRLSVISYHSLEDRLVKNFIKKGKFQGELETDIKGNPIVPLIPVNRQVIVPSDEEQKQNNRARSAKLRIAKKI